MSGVAKGVKKVFKKVGKVAKKILPFALPAAAAVFTLGGALGLTPTFGGAISGLMGKMGMTGTLGKVLGGAITHAGFGGLAGGAIGGIAGGKKGMVRGLGLGQMAGAVTGGISGYMSAGAAPAAAGATQQGGISQATGATAPRDVSASSRVMTRMGMEGGGSLPGQSDVSSFVQRPGGIPASAPSTGMGWSPPGMPAGAAQTQAATGLTSAVRGLPSSGMVAPATGLGMAAAPAASGFKSLDPMVQAAMITSLGAALPSAVGALTGGDDENQQLEVEEARRKAIAANYTPNIGGYQTFSGATRPVQSFRYDPSVGRIVPIYG